MKVLFATTKQAKIGKYKISLEKKGDIIPFLNNMLYNTN